MTARIAIISDLHLGRPHCAAKSVEALRPIWDGVDRLIINGDLAEVHHPDHWALAARQTLQLFDLCEADGVELTLLSGNHDPYITDLRHLHLAGDSVFITHGDVMHPAVSPWSPAHARIRAAHERALAALEPERRNDLEARLSASQHAAYAEWTDLDALADEAAHSTLTGMVIRPWAIVKVLLYWHAFPRFAAEFTAEHAPEARFIIVGHTHLAGIWEVDDRLVINTGSFGFPGRPRAVTIEDRTLSIVPIVHRKGTHRLDASSVRTFELPEPVESIPSPTPDRSSIVERIESQRESSPVKGQSRSKIA